eukprot:g1099.t1
MADARSLAARSRALLRKLGHPLRTVRERALTNVRFKLSSSILSAHDIARERGAVDALLNMVRTAPHGCSRDESHSDTIVLDTLGLLHKLVEENDLGPGSSHNAAREQLMRESAVEVLRARACKHQNGSSTDGSSAAAVATAAENLLSVLMSHTQPSDGSARRANGNYDHDALDGDRGAPNIESEVKEGLTVISKSQREPGATFLTCRGWRFAPVVLTSADAQQIFEFRVRFELLFSAKAAARHCALLRDELMHDFPAEVFIERSAIVQHVLALLLQVPAPAPTSMPDTLQDVALDTLSTLLDGLYASFKLLFAGIYATTRVPASSSNSKDMFHFRAHHAAQPRGQLPRAFFYPQPVLQLAEGCADSGDAYDQHQSGCDRDCHSAWSLSGTHYQIFISLCALLKHSTQPRLILSVIPVLRKCTRCLLEPQQQRSSLTHEQTVADDEVEGDILGMNSSDAMGCPKDTACAFECRAELDGARIRGCLAALDDVLHFYSTRANPRNAAVLAHSDQGKSAAGQEGVAIVQLQLFIADFISSLPERVLAPDRNSTAEGEVERNDSGKEVVVRLPQRVVALLEALAFDQFAAVSRPWLAQRLLPLLRRLRPAAVAQFQHAKAVVRASYSATDLAEGASAAITAAMAADGAAEGYANDDGDIDSRSRRRSVWLREGFDAWARQSLARIRSLLSALPFQDCAGRNIGDDTDGAVRTALRVCASICVVRGDWSEVGTTQDDVGSKTSVDSGALGRASGLLLLRLLAFPSARVRQIGYDELMHWAMVACVDDQFDSKTMESNWQGASMKACLTEDEHELLHFVLSFGASSLATGSTSAFAHDFLAQLLRHGILGEGEGGGENEDEAQMVIMCARDAACDALVAFARRCGAFGQAQIVGQPWALAPGLAAFVPFVNELQCIAAPHAPGLNVSASQSQARGAAQALLSSLRCTTPPLLDSCNQLAHLARDLFSRNPEARTTAAAVLSLRLGVKLEPREAILDILAPLPTGERRMCWTREPNATFAVSDLFHISDIVCGTDDPGDDTQHVESSLRQAAAERLVDMIRNITSCTTSSVARIRPRLMAWVIAILSHFAAQGLHHNPKVMLHDDACRDQATKSRTDVAVALEVLVALLERDGTESYNDDSNVDADIGGNSICVGVASRAFTEHEPNLRALICAAFCSTTHPRGSNLVPMPVPRSAVVRVQQAARSALCRVLFGPARANGRWCAPSFMLQYFAIGGDEGPFVQDVSRSPYSLAGTCTESRAAAIVADAALLDLNDSDGIDVDTCTTDDGGLAYRLRSGRALRAILDADEAVRIAIDMAGAATTHSTCATAVLQLRLRAKCDLHFGTALCRCDWRTEGNGVLARLMLATPSSHRDAFVLVEVIKLIEVLLDQIYNDKNGEGALAQLCNEFMQQQLVPVLFSTMPGDLPSPTPVSVPDTSKARTWAGTEAMNDAKNVRACRAFRVTGLRLLWLVFRVYARLQKCSKQCAVLVATRVSALADAGLVTMLVRTLEVHNHQGSAENRETVSDAAMQCLAADTLHAMLCVTTLVFKRLRNAVVRERHALTAVLSRGAEVRRLIVWVERAAAQRHIASAVECDDVMIGFVPILLALLARHRSAAADSFRGRSVVRAAARCLHASSVLAVHLDAFWATVSRPKDMKAEEVRHGAEDKSGSALASAHNWMFRGGLSWQHWLLADREATLRAAGRAIISALLHRPWARRRLFCNDGVRSVVSENIAVALDPQECNVVRAEALDIVRTVLNVSVDDDAKEVHAAFHSKNDSDVHDKDVHGASGEGVTKSMLRRRCHQLMLSLPQLLQEPLQPRKHAVA